MTLSPVWILALAFLMLLCPASSQALQPYQGFTEYDGRPATLTLTFGGLSVTGNLHVNPVCEQSSHLTGVDINLVGTATGPWENEATTITGTWNGGDLDPCSGNTITNDDSYPNTGSFTISIDELDGRNVVRLVRMPTGYGYIFEPKGSVLAGSGGSGGSGGTDLTITELSVPTGISPGMNAEIVVTFKNDGAAAAGPFKLYGYAFPNQANKIFESNPVQVEGLEAGETGSTSVFISIPSNAPNVAYDVKVAIDNSNYGGPGDVVETDENNNEKWKQKVSGPERGPSAENTGSNVDLAVTEVSVDPEQAYASPGKLTFTMELKNLGKAQAKGFNAGFYLSEDRSITTNDTYIGYGVIDLEPGESRSGPVPCNLPADLTPGLYYIGVIADPLEDVAESDETNNARATDEPLSVPASLTRISSGVQASDAPGSQSEVVYLQPGETHTYQMPPAAFADGKKLEEQGIISLTQSEYSNFVKWGPAGVLSGDGEETLGTGNSITLTAMKEGTATVRMTVFWEARRSDGKVSQGYQDFTWTVIVGSDYSGGSLDKNKPSSSTSPEKKGEITDGKIRGRAIYRPTGEPVAGAVIHSIDFEDEAKGGYPVHKLNSDGSVKEMLRTGPDGSFEIDIATWVPSGLDPGRFWIRIIKPYDGYLVQDIWETACLDLWVVQSPLKTFSLDRDLAQAGPIDAGVIMMDRASSVFPGLDCPIDPSTGRPADDPNWP